MRWLQLAEVLELHRRLIDQSGGTPGIRDLGLLEASLAQPRQTFGGIDLYPELTPPWSWSSNQLAQRKAARIRRCSQEAICLE